MAKLYSPSISSFVGDCVSLSSKSLSRVNARRGVLHPTILDYSPSEGSLSIDGSHSRKTRSPVREIAARTGCLWVHRRVGKNARVREPREAFTGRVSRADCQLVNASRCTCEHRLSPTLALLLYISPLLFYVPPSTYNRGILRL